MLNVNAARGKNPNYLVQIRNQSAGISVVLDMPESLSMTISNSWEPRFSAGLNDLNGFLDTSMKLIGENVLLQELSLLAWMNATPIEIPFSFTFDAVKDAYEDVFLPMTALELLALPDNQGVFLTAPGPSRLAPDRNKIEIWIGRSYYLPSVVITSVASNPDMLFNKDGYPISGQVDMSVSTTMIYGKTDWLATKIHGAT